MAGLARADVDIKLPPHLIKYLGKTHDAWHISIEILQKMIESGRLTEVPNDDLNSQERTLDALTELFSDLNENDIFYGLWRRHCTYIETNIALSFEQSSMWSQAQTIKTATVGCFG
ncbi:hypothetical protein G6F68_017430 [Rhizopus microsporus]|nr:hypothetical protein G6F68_017430 [Rhizopus microsporus]